ncbi:Arylsulfatase A [Mariniphaga anaerophila]|uniref:Arylsulfatase A n=1 Tax=Mariniphaga anaerophila TaxID=1484053 RepID=A0A1M5BN34_9BACT|nr:sulfatase [Mariniphaga anaerophila]SHF43954.1 Arylsulfatase A [Mariniphaga anaerophila]
MKTRVQSSSFPLLVLLFIFGWSNASENIRQNTTGDKELITDSAGYSEGFIEQQISYYAPQSASVYLLWKTDGYPLEESVSWNDETKFKDGFLCNPMKAFGDTFNIKIKVPHNSTLEFYFWITKNKQGHYQDFWDIGSSGKTIANESVAIIKTANYSKVEAQKEINLVKNGWFILLLFTFIYLPLKWGQKRWLRKISAPSPTESVLFIGASMFAFHALARSEIININLAGIIYNWRLIPQILKGSIDDFVVVAVIVFTFALLLRWPKILKIKKLVFVTFTALAALSTLIAFINIKTVVYFGKPFTYQWLYYSDFLGSNEAKSAFQENLDIGTVLNLASIVIAMFLFAGILRTGYQIFTLRKQIKIATVSVLGVAAILLAVLTYKADASWTKGQSGNAIKVMAGSILKANSNNSFFTAKLPANTNPFDPRMAVPADFFVDSTKNQNVKNVLFVVLESAGAVYFDAYGGTFQLSPNLNKYAQQALIFEQMYAHAPATNRSLVSILGSIYPYLSYKSLTQEAPKVELPTISSELKAKGYRTSFFSTADLNFQNCNQFLSNRGFDVIEDFANIKCAEEFHLDNSDYLEGNGKDDMCLADRLASWLDEDTTQNFFSMMWTVQGHYPYFFGDEEENFDVSEVNYNRYLNCLKYNDEVIGNVMQILEDRNLAETTLVVVFGDHGEAFGQHGQYGHATSLYEENIKVPLYFINPVLFSGERKSDIAGMKDLATTVFPIIGEDCPSAWQGRNLLNTYSTEGFFLAPWSDYLFGYRNNNMKYIFNETLNSVEVFDLASDPHETKNLAQLIPEEELDFAKNRIAAWVQFQGNFISNLMKTNDKKQMGK